MNVLLWAALVSMGGIDLPAEIAQGQVGEWVTLRLSSTGQRESFLYLALVGEERDTQGTASVWFELEMASHPSFSAPLGQVRFLMTRKGTQILRAFVGLGASVPQEVPQDRVRSLFSKVVPSSMGAEQALRMRSGSATVLQTPAGRLLATPVEGTFSETLVQRLWLSREVPLIHIARWEFPVIGHSIEVVGFGRDAKTRVRILENAQRGGPG
jgi:hypothetical protein